MRSLLALIVAAAMVAGAVAVRARLDEEGVAALLPGSEPLRVACIAELEQACADLAAAHDDLTVTAAGAGALLEELSADEAPYDVWLTVDPLPQMARERAGRAGGAPAVAETTDVLARSPAVLAVWDERADVLAEQCPDLDWRCIGDLVQGTWADAGGPAVWGPVKLGYADPSASAGGLLVLAQQASSYVGGGPFSAASLTDPDFFSWFTALQRSGRVRPAAQPLLQEMITTSGAAVDVVGLLEAEAIDLLNRAAERGQPVRLLEVAPEVTADVVAAGVGQRGAEAAERLVDVAPDALADHGWRAGRTRAWPVRDLPVRALGDHDGLPAPGVLEALRSTWLEVM